MTTSNIWRLTVISALLYVMSAVCFVWAAVRNGGAVGVAGSILFLAAAVVLFVPLVAGRPGRATDPGAPADPEDPYHDRVNG